MAELRCVGTPLARKVCHKQPVRNNAFIEETRQPQPLRVMKIPVESRTERCASSRDRLVEFAKDMRMALEPGLQRSENGAVSAEGACLHASLLLCFTLDKFKIAATEIRGGDGDLHEGALGTDGHWYGHYWVEATTADQATFVVDITADQFGHAAIYVEPLTASKARYRPGRQDAVDRAAVALAETFGDRNLTLAAAVRAC